MHYRRTIVAVFKPCKCILKKCGAQKRWLQHILNMCWKLQVVKYVIFLKNEVKIAIRQSVFRKQCSLTLSKHHSFPRKEFQFIIRMLCTKDRYISFAVCTGDGRS